MIVYLKWVNVALRGIMELGLVLSLAYWGFWVGHSPFLKIMLCISTPLIVFTLWGVFDFRNVVKNPEPFRLVEELVITGLASYALYATGLRALGILLASISILHHILVYTLGETLLKN